ncbi:MAG: AMP-dependent synthetase/ligase [Longimicrobiales bacterium]
MTTTGGDMAATTEPAVRYASMPAELPAGTLVDLFLHAVDRHDKADALLRRGPTTWQPISHRTLFDDVRTLTHALRTRLGVQRGDRIALLSENRAEWLIADYAILAAGALTVPLYATLPANQLAAILSDCGATIVVVSNGAQLAKIRELQKEHGQVERTIVMEDDAADGDAIAWRALLEEARADRPSEEDFRQEAQRAQPEDVATLIYTSGTTGTPKGVMLTHDNMYSNVYGCFTTFEIGTSDVNLSFLPLSHSFQRMLDYCMFWVGATIAHVGNFDDVARSLTEVRPTVAAASPRVYEKLYARILQVEGLKRRLVLWARGIAIEVAEARLTGGSVGAWTRVQHAIADRLVYTKVRAALGGRIRFFISGSAPLAQQVAYFFFGAGVMILEGYGLTETSPVTNVNRPESIRIGTVGPPVPGTEIRIADDGEILIRGPQVMKGYWNNPEATREVIDEEGWFHSGDIGRLDPDGLLRITDRKKEILVTAGGKNVAPQPLENAAKLSPFVSEALMVGDRKPYTIILVVPNFHNLEGWARREGLRWSTREELARMPEVRTKLEREMAERLADFARYERPKKVLPLERELTLERGEITPSFKVKRRVVEKSFADRIEAIYAEPAPAERPEPAAHA